VQETFKSSREFFNGLSLRVQQILYALITYGLLLVICLLAVSPEQYDLNVGDVAPKTITASKDIIDEITTERRRQMASNAVSPVYYKDDTISDTVLADMESVFSELRAVRELGAQIRGNWTSGGSFTDEDRVRIAADIRRLCFDVEARAMADEYLDKAQACLDKLPRRFEQKVFREALDFVRNRKS
jgi:membrane-associated HD superfamily phosphohydrolase